MPKYSDCNKIASIIQITRIIKIFSSLMKSIPLTLLISLILLALASCHIQHHTKQQIQQKIGKTKIMYGATIRIKAVMFNYYLHSHMVNYPRGSGQQSVTGFPGDNDYNSLWTIKQANHQTVKTYYHELKCGDTIRLEHALTKRNLHSEEIYQSMVTNGQEVSGYGFSGEGDDNDNWVLSCLNRQTGEDFYGGDTFELIHQNTEKRLKMSRYYEYSYMNWQNCPFQGQLQVSLVGSPTKQTQFKIVGGVFFKQSASKSNGSSGQNEDL